MASVRCWSLQGRSSSCSDHGDISRINIQVLVQTEAEARAGISIWAASYEGASEPAAIVALHVARHVEGVCPFLPHGGPKGGSPEGFKSPGKSWRL